MKKAESAGTLPETPVTKVVQPAAKIETPQVEEEVKPTASPEPAKDDQNDLNELLTEIKEGELDEQINNTPENLLEDFSEPNSIEKINNAINARKNTDNFKNKGFNTKRQAVPTNITSGRTNVNEGMPSIQQSNLAPSIKVTSGGKRKNTRKKGRGDCNT